MRLLTLSLSERRFASQKKTLALQSCMLWCWNGVVRDYHGSIMDALRNLGGRYRGSIMDRDCLRSGWTLSWLDHKCYSDDRRSAEGVRTCADWLSTETSATRSSGLVA